MIVHILTVIFLSYLLWRWMYIDLNSNTLCVTSVLDNTTLCREKCQHGYFSLNGMKSCLPWLMCEDIKQDVLPGDVIGEGAVKIVKMGMWKKQRVVLNQLKNHEYIQDFQDGLVNLISFQPNQLVVQLIGLCQNSHTFITEYHRLQSADKIDNILHNSKQLDNLITRYKLCLNYIEIILYLHSNAKGSRVMCDSNNPLKALSQLLIRDDFTLLLNDADALPISDVQNNILVKCGHKELTGDYVAPEQLWPFEAEFDDNIMPGYDETTDIWKLPDVCQLLLNGVSGSTGVLLKLFEINSKCKSDDPLVRPTAQVVLQSYQQVYDELTQP